MKPNDLCYICGENEQQNRHHVSCPYRWHGKWEPTVILRLNAYQAANLLKFLCLVWYGKIQPPNSGDWQGEIPFQLGAKMIEAGSEFRTWMANGGGSLDEGWPEGRVRWDSNHLIRFEPKEEP